MNDFGSLLSNLPKSDIFLLLIPHSDLSFIIFELILGCDNFFQIIVKVKVQLNLFLFLLSHQILQPTTAVSFVLCHHLSAVNKSSIGLIFDVKANLKILLSGDMDLITGRTSSYSDYFHFKPRLDVVVEDRPLILEVFD